jgi:capsule polysaccharide export protein KpsE/RkpR
MQDKTDIQEELLKVTEQLNLLREVQGDAQEDIQQLQARKQMLQETLDQGKTML